MTEQAVADVGGLSLAPAVHECVDHRVGVPERVGTNPDLSYQTRRFLLHRPLHPGRFLGLLQLLPVGLWRLSGTFWVASRPADVGFVDVLGLRTSVRHVGAWLAAVPDACHSVSALLTLKQQGLWDSAYGDRCQDLVVAGRQHAVAETLQLLSASLLTDEELGEPAHWASLEQPSLWTLETA